MKKLENRVLRMGAWATQLSFPLPPGTGMFDLQSLVELNRGLSCNGVS